MELLASDTLLAIRTEQATLISQLDTTFRGWKNAPLDQRQRVTDLHNEYQAAYSSGYKKASGYCTLSLAPCLTTDSEAGHGRILSEARRCERI